MLRARVIALVAAAFISALALGAPTASAHSQLVSTSPADGAVLDAPPELVSFTFDEPLLPGTVTVSINDDQGKVISTVEALVDEATISAPWPTAAESGTFQIAYRVVSEDGHPVTGAITVTIAGQPAQPETAPAPSTAPTVSPSSTAESEPARGLAPTLVIAVAIGVFVLAAIVCLTFWRGRKNY